jgi:ubiquinone/menaquinone biosynthesis C-methylase UbiE
MRCSISYPIREGIPIFLPADVDFSTWEEYAAESGTTSFPHEILNRFCGKKILDVGCGNGKHLAGLKDKELKVGLEVSLKRLQEGLKNFPDIYFLLASAYRIPLKDRTVDTVIMIDVIEHLDDPSQALKEVVRVLDVGGRLVLQTPNYPIKRLYDFINYLRGSRRSFKDDPTHVSKFTWTKIRNLISKFFVIEEISTRNVLGERRVISLQKIKNKSLGLLFGQKTIIIAQKIQ